MSAIGECLHAMCIYCSSFCLYVLFVVCLSAFCNDLQTCTSRGNVGVMPVLGSVSAAQVAKPNSGGWASKFNHDNVCPSLPIIYAKNKLTFAIFVATLTCRRWHRRGITLLT